MAIKMRPKPTADWLMFAAKLNAIVFGLNPDDAAIHSVDMGEWKILVLRFPGDVVLPMPAADAGMVDEAAERLSCGDKPRIHIG